MKFDLSVPLVSYDGKLFTRPVESDDGEVRQEPLTLKSVLVSACVNADPQEHNDADKKLAVFSLLMKLHEANPFVHLKAEEVSVLKKLIGKQLTVVAVGVVCKALESPLPEVKAE
jgi:hypothetical protein